MEKILNLQGIHKHFPVISGKFLRKQKKLLRAVDGVSFDIEQGSCFALAGESGSGKSTIARMILKLETPTKGVMEFNGRDMGRFTRKDDMWYRSKVLGVFQDASGSLNPRMRIGDIVSEPLQIQRDADRNNLSKAEMRDKVEEIIKLVGLLPRVMNSYPHELSGGQKQRVAIARAMILNPSMVVLDEPVSALDVSIQAQILNLLADIQEKLGLTYFLIAHDLAMLGYVSTKIAVLYLGRIVEMGNTDEVYSKPLHPYTNALFQAMPLPDPWRVKAKAGIQGEIGSALSLTTGCRFYSRCERAKSRCQEVEPDLVEVAPGHSVACHLL